MFLQSGLGLALLFSFICKAKCDIDPCKRDNHVIFPEAGSRNTKCRQSFTTCDYFLDPDWYVSPSSLLINKCPPIQSCGVPYPTWMNGTFPSVNDGIVNRTACTNRRGKCCAEQIPMKIKNCSGYYVYYLKDLKECPSVYCFESAFPCEEPTTSTQTTVTSTKTTTEQNKGPGIDKGLLIGILTGLAVLILMSAAILLLVIKTKSCRKVGNSTVNITSSPPGHNQQNQQPPPYEEIQKTVKHY